MDDRDWTGNGWTKYQKLVLRQLEDHTQALKIFNEKINDLHIEIATFKATLKSEHRIYSSLYGFVGALIPIVLQFVLKK